VTALARVSNWQEGIQIFSKSPIIGYGFNMVSALPHNAPTLEPGTLARSTSGYDNSIIFILVTAGIVGLSAFLFLWSQMVRIGIGLYKNLKQRAAGIMYLSILAAVIIHSMFLNTLFYPQVMILLWIISGAVEKEESK
jgi:O-antigen ligase